MDQIFTKYTSKADFSDYLIHGRMNPSCSRGRSIRGLQIREAGSCSCPRDLLHSSSSRRRILLIQSYSVQSKEIVPGAWQRTGKPVVLWNGAVIIAIVVIRTERHRRNVVTMKEFRVSLKGFGGRRNPREFLHHGTEIGGVRSQNSCGCAPRCPGAFFPHLGR